MSLRFLKDFIVHVLHDDVSLSTDDVKKLIIMPATLKLTCRYVEVPGLVPPEDVGRPTYFASHAWSGCAPGLFLFFMWSRLI